MTTSIADLFTHNRVWAAAMVRQRPGFFTELLAQQQPKYIWIGCSDSRVPANQITGLQPGEIFVHRNVGNLVLPTDLNCLSTIRYAVDPFQIHQLMVVDHYGCGGVETALVGIRVGLADKWLRHIKDVCDRHCLPLKPRRQSLSLHGWVYGLKVGLLHDLHITVASNHALEAAYFEAIRAVAPELPARAAIKTIAKPNSHVSSTT